MKRILAFTVAAALTAATGAVVLKSRSPFFFANAAGAARESSQGMVPADSVRARRSID